MRELFLNELITLQTLSDSETSESNRKVELLLLGDLGKTGCTLTGSLIACDTNLTHILLNDLQTPIGFQSNALVRLNDVLAISYC